MTDREICERIAEYGCSDDDLMCEAGGCPLFEGEWDCAFYASCKIAAEAWLDNDDKKERDNMTKEQALKQIKELEKFVEEMDKPKSGVATFKVANNEHRIDGVWAFTVMTQTEGKDYAGSKKAGRSASLFLSGHNGTWYDANGAEVNASYLYFKPYGE